MADSNGPLRVPVNGHWKEGLLRYIVQPLIAMLLGLIAYIAGQIVKSEDGLHAEYGALMKEEDVNAQRLSALETAFKDLKERFDRHETTPNEPWKK